MKLLTVIFLFGLFCPFALSAPTWSPSNVPISSIHQQLSRSGDQKCRINICFAIDGSGSVSSTEFQKAKRFTQDIASVVGSGNTESSFGAVQYGTDSETISPQTQDFLAFIGAVQSTNSKSATATSIAAGIAACDSQLAQTEGEASRIILISDGRNNFGADPVVAANNYRARDPNGILDAVALGRSDIGKLKALADGGLVITNFDFIELVTAIDNVC